MKKYLISFLLTAAIVFVSCSGSDTEKSITLRKGRYNYFLMDSSGTSLVEGSMKIDSIIKMSVGGDRNNYKVSGTYTVDKLTSDNSYHGFSTMNGGAFTGFYNDSLKSIGINTNPKIADANIFFNGDVTSSSIKGYWYYSSFRGVDKEAGFFKANKVK